MYYTYILYSETLKKFYTGQTESLERRLLEHNHGKTEFMKTGIPWIIVFSKSFQSRGEANAKGSAMGKCEEIRNINTYLEQIRSR